MTARLWSFLGLELSWFLVIAVNLCALGLLVGAFFNFCDRFKEFRKK